MKGLIKLGQDISDARKRRRITINLMAMRAGLSPSTIAKIKKGEQITSIGAYVSVLFVLGIINRLSDLVDSAHDLSGRRLEDEKLPKRVRIPNKKI